MKTSQLIEILEAGSYSIATFNGVTVDNRPYYDTETTALPVPVAYSVVTGDKFERVPAEIPLVTFFKSNGIGTTIRIPTYYNNRLYKTDVYTRVERSEGVNTWLKSSTVASDSGVVEDIVEDTVITSATEIEEPTDGS